MKIETKSNIKRTVGLLRKVQGESPEAFKRVVREFAEQAKIEVQNNFVPVRTGDLRSTVRVEDDNDSISLVAGGIDGLRTGGLVDYAFFVNYGTSRQPARLFMEKGVARALSDSSGLAFRSLVSWSKSFNN